jgi:FkbM family methyltransferase
MRPGPVGRARSPSWARLYQAYEARVPNHRGKRTLLRLALRGAARLRPQPFAWPMRNGTRLAIAPADGLGFQGTVGWTCFRTGEWDPHIERCVRSLLRPGDVALDIGANIGYVATVMAQSVGPAGRVVALEPVPGTWAQLRLAAQLNDFSWLTPLQLAVGSASGFVGIAVDPRNTGNASIHRSVPASGGTVEVPVRRLDDLLAELAIGPPALIKIDVEGHELEVLRGGRNTIEAARPTIIFEYAVELAERAGWGPADAKELLAGYDFLLLEEDGLKPIDLDRWVPSAGRYAYDLVARPSSGKR